MQKSVIFSLLFVLFTSQAHAGVQIMSGITRESSVVSYSLGFQYAWLRTTNQAWQFCTPGFVATGNGTRGTVELTGFRFKKLSRSAWVNPPDFRIGFQLIGHRHDERFHLGTGLAVSLGW